MACNFVMVVTYGVPNTDVTKGSEGGEGRGRGGGEVGR